MNILLVCAAGMSTSLLVNRMNEAAAAKGIELHIEAHPVGSIDQYGDSADVIDVYKRQPFSYNFIVLKIKGKVMIILKVNTIMLMELKGTNITWFANSLIILKSFTQFVSNLTSDIKEIHRRNIYMRKDLGDKMQFMPLPVLMLATYDQDGKANVMNACLLYTSKHCPRFLIKEFLIFSRRNFKEDNKNKTHYNNN